MNTGNRSGCRILVGDISNSIKGKNEYISRYEHWRKYCNRSGNNYWIYHSSWCGNYTVKNEEGRMGRRKQ